MRAGDTISDGFSALDLGCRDGSYLAMSPVNSFRLVMRSPGWEMELLPDMSSSSGCWTAIEFIHVETPESPPPGGKRISRRRGSKDRSPLRCALQGGPDMPAFVRWSPGSGDPDPPAPRDMAYRSRLGRPTTRGQTPIKGGIGRLSREAVSGCAAQRESPRCAPRLRWGALFRREYDPQAHA